MAVQLSPLVLLNIADSLKRNLSKIGVLRGHRSRNALLILNSFEAPLVDGSLDMTYIADRNSLMNQVYPEEVGIIGCYVINDDLNFDVVNGMTNELNGQVVMIFSPKMSISKDGKYYKVFSPHGRELKVEIMNNGKEAVNTVLDLKDVNNEMTKSKDMVDTQKDVLSIMQERVSILIKALESGSLEYDTLRKVNSLWHKLNYKVDDDIKEQLVELENDYKLILTTGLIYENLNSLESANANSRRFVNDA
jgi:hypothetical protein